ncbi:hypothetical protein LCGC14_1200910 [marine sediment metagenome]|uniref:Uncharacterized protein n=1 Tax=marine sediment metagenome TaxID=412755 RepID=A0A0F9NZB5_9ZZZZ
MTRTTASRRGRAKRVKERTSSEKCVMCGEPAILLQHWGLGKVMINDESGRDCEEAKCTPYCRTHGLGKRAG